jgi:predicted Rossmann fold flavoprotein
LIKTDVVIIGAGAAGLMCAMTAGSRRRQVLVIDHANKAGKKILMSGGGRCNFTNYYINPDNYLSHNPHFCKSALRRYTQWDFVELVKRHKIAFHEKIHGQLFCDNKAKDIQELLLNLCEKNNVTVKLNTSINEIKQLNPNHFVIKTAADEIHCESLVVACGGLSIPTMGATAFGYKIAEQFGLSIWPTRAGLVPLTLHVEDKNKFADLAGVAVAATITNSRISFAEDMLFTHRGLSGPGILQISSYWHPGEKIIIDLLPTHVLTDYLKHAQITQPQKQVNTILSELLPKSLIEIFLPPNIATKKTSQLSYQDISLITQVLQQWHLLPNGTEGYRTAEVTLGGVDCDQLSSKTMEVNQIAGLYFIGEVVDVTGWLGGYNFQWAWSSGWAAGQVV